MQRPGLLINGVEGPALSNEVYPVRNPATKEIIAEAPLADEQDLARAVSAARNAFCTWKRMKAKERAVLLRRLATLVDQNRGELAKLEVADSGWPYAFVEQHHLTRCIDLLDYFAGTIDKIGGRVVPIDPDYLSYTVREPYGVVGLLVPWNAPLSSAFLGLAPALACGNTVILKPSQETPLATLALGRLFREAGFPDGVVNILSGSGSVLGAALASHPGVDKISLTGGVETGKEVMRLASGNIKGLTLELGGKTPVLVFADADLAAAAKRIAFSAFLHQGQICTAASRLLIEEGIADQFTGMVVEEAQKLRIGDPMDPETQIGPMISARHRSGVMEFIEKGKASGAKLVLGGTVPASEVLSNGYYMTPTIFTHVNPASEIAQKEIFGPVLSVMTFRDENEALAIANGVKYGLGSSIWTSNLQRAHSLTQKLEDGLVWVNCLNLSHPAIPHGGFKSSGYGLENGIEAAMQSYSKSKTVWIHVGNG